MPSLGRKFPWRNAYKIKLLLFIFCNISLAVETLSTRSTLPAPIVIPASQNWDGNDGPWSSFAVQIGTPPQLVQTFLSTAATQTWAVAPGGCISSDPSNCTDTRGTIYSYNQSTSWVPNLANTSTQIYDLGLEAGLGYQGVGKYGFDNITIGFKGEGGPSLLNQTIASIVTTDFWLGIFGVNPRPSNFTNFNDPIDSFMANLRLQSKIPSVSWAYTAGNQYRLNSVLANLVLGGYDSSKFIPNNLTWNMAPANDRDLVVQIEAITSGGQSLLPTSIPVFLDSTVPYIYLPVEACEKFESAFNLTWDNVTSLYLLSDAQHLNLVQKSPNITFTLGNLTSPNKVDIIFPYAAFDLTISYPHVVNATKYFPLKRADSIEQYTFGRTFFQEAYVIADYERRIFYVSQCNWDDILPQNIVSIQPLPTSNNTPSFAHKSPPIAAIVASIGGVIIIICLLLLYGFLRRRNLARKATAEKLAAANVVEPIMKPELDGYERQPKIYETGPEVDVQNDGKQYIPGAQEIGPSGRNSPVYEMAAEEVASEMSGTSNPSELRDLSGPRSPTTASTPNERTRFLGDGLGSPRSPRSLRSLARPRSPGNLGSPDSSASIMVSPSSMLRVDRRGRGSPVSAVSAMSPSIDFRDTSPVDEMWI